MTAARTTARTIMRTGFSRGIASAATAVALLVGAAAPVVAQAIPSIRDAEIEALLKEYSRPIFRVAGLGGQNITMRIVRADSFNAFVVDGRSVFVNHGTLLLAKSPNEVIGVIAHETGHITGGHMAALRARIARDQTKAMLVTILGLGMMVGGAVGSHDSQREIGGLGQGVMLGGNDVIMRGVLSERRSQESAADQAGLKFLFMTKQSGRGMLETFERFARDEYISDTYKDPFVRSHPVATERLAQLRERVAQSPYASTIDPPALQLRHDMMRAKIAAYMERPQTVLNRYPGNDQSLPARYARAIVANCSGKCSKAIGEIDALIREQPNNPYFWELKGTLLYLGGQRPEAVAPMRKALALVGGEEPLMQTQLAQILLALKEPGMVDEAIRQLRRVVAVEQEDSSPHRMLAEAFYNKEMAPQSDLARATADFIDGQIKQAKIYAKRAQVKFANGSPEWLKSEDIINYKDPNQPGQSQP